MSFLALLRDDIRLGLSKTPAEFRTRHANWLCGLQTAGGGFANRRGEADLYYTAFALRSLSALDKLTADIAAKARAYLAGLIQQSSQAQTRQPKGAFCDAVMAASWWDSLALCDELFAAGSTPELDLEGARRRTERRLDALRRDDGGWAKTDADACGSLYHTFLAACAYMRMGVVLPNADSARKLLRSLAQPGGGFLENRYSKRPGTNGCAAAVGLSVMLEQEIEIDPHAAYVAGMFSGEGGFFATPAAPIADLLSTYTGLLTLKMLGKQEDRFVAGALRYARGLEHTNGGYAGFALEQVRDAEYAFYGLGVESIGALCSQT
jgi:geranylgeranyl transferase type-2 subunit beta